MYLSRRLRRLKYTLKLCRRIVVSPASQLRPDTSSAPDGFDAQMPGATTMIRTSVVFLVATWAMADSSQVAKDEFSASLPVRSGRPAEGLDGSDFREGSREGEKFSLTTALAKVETDRDEEFLGVGSSMLEKQGCGPQKKYRPGVVEGRFPVLQGPRGGVKIFHHRRIEAVGATNEFGAWRLPCEIEPTNEENTTGTQPGECDNEGNRKYTRMCEHSPDTNVQSQENLISRECVRIHIESALFPWSMILLPSFPRRRSSIGLVATFQRARLVLHSQKALATHFIQ